MTKRALVAAMMLAFVCGPANAIDLCDDKGTRGTCIVDGDTGWENGRKWRLLAIDAPELHHAECERELALAFQAGDRLAELMTQGYQLHPSGRQDIYNRALVTIRLRDGRDAGEVLLAEGLAQPWPNRGNRWCGKL